MVHGVKLAWLSQPPISNPWPMALCFLFWSIGLRREFHPKRPMYVSTNTIESSQ
ncbi:hypothetical protein EVA_20200 [gut metagenome]|uniref:Uncharacterized protein n=1 Tax=gut metagenome TaxID=749906 RepID=J9FB75_9ZZZZ